MKLVILDGYCENPGDLDWAPVAAFGDLTVYDRTPIEDTQEIIRRIGDAEAVFINKTPLRAEVFEACTQLQFVGVLATGYNVVDCAAAAAHGIPVCNIPSYGTDAVAQFTFALLLEVCHAVGHHSEAVHAGRWCSSEDYCFWDTKLIELAGKTMGIIGFGRIGQAVGRIAKAFGMRVLASSRSEREEGRAIAEYVPLDTLLAESDVVSLHCLMTPQTAQLINRTTIEKMKDGAILLNTSRGGLVNEQDLCDALNSGKLYMAAVDVVSYEPMKADNPLLRAKNCIITPHIAWAPKESRQRIMDETVRNIRAFLAGSPINVVNAPVEKIK